MSKILVSILRFWWKLSVKYNKKFNHKPVGVPFQRDPDNVCESYMPYKNNCKSIFTDCGTDGHYMCKDCIHNMYRYPYAQSNDNFTLDLAELYGYNMKEEQS